MKKLLILAVLLIAFAGFTSAVWNQIGVVGDEIEDGVTSVPKDDEESNSVPVILMGGGDGGSPLKFTVADWGFIIQPSKLKIGV